MRLRRNRYIARGRSGASLFSGADPGFGLDPGLLLSAHGLGLCVSLRLGLCASLSRGLFGGQSLPRLFTGDGLLLGSHGLGLRGSLCPDLGLGL